MSLMDGLLLFSGSPPYPSNADPNLWTGQAITTTAISQNVIDLRHARDLGWGDPAMKLLVRPVVAFTAGGAATLTIQFQGSVDNSTYTTYAQSDALAVAGLTAGANLYPINLPRRSLAAARPRYYRLNYVVATGPMTAGSLIAALVLEDAVSEQYPAGITLAN